MKDYEMEYAEILAIVEKFYSKAKDDQWIGFQFTKITDFEAHLPRIADFWQMHLYGKRTRFEAQNEAPYRLALVHQQLQITKGHLGRWVILFEEVLAEEFEQTLLTEKRMVIEKWKVKIKEFEQLFLHHPALFR